MNWMNGISCPVSPNRVDENTVRISAFSVLILGAVGLLLNQPLVGLGMAADFGIRAFTSGRWSPLRFMARTLARAFGVPTKPTDAAPKKFAAGLGMVFSFLVALFQWVGLMWTAWGVGFGLLACAFLESVFAFCLGCVVYSLLFRGLAQWNRYVGRV